MDILAELFFPIVPSPCLGLAYHVMPTLACAKAGIYGYDI